MTEAPSWTKNDLPEALQAALETGLDRKARAPVVLRVAELSGYTDWVLILSGRSDRNVKAIADAIVKSLDQRGQKPMGSDGRQSGEWTLLDYDDFMVHIFYHPVRSYFDLESMWNDAPKIDLELSDEVMDTADLEVLTQPKVMPEFAGERGFGGFQEEFNDFSDARFDDAELSENEDDDLEWQDLSAPPKPKEGLEADSSDPAASQDAELDDTKLDESETDLDTEADSGPDPSEDEDPDKKKTSATEADKKPSEHDDLFED